MRWREKSCKVPVCRAWLTCASHLFDYLYSHVMPRFPLASHGGMPLNEKLQPFLDFPKMKVQNTCNLTWVRCVSMKATAVKGLDVPWCVAWKTLHRKSGVIPKCIFMSMARIRQHSIYTRAKATPMWDEDGIHSGPEKPPILAIMSKISRAR